jgi:hypothetical protein
LRRGDRYQTLLGVTGSGKTVTMAAVMAEIGLPTLVMSHNKTLAAQLYGELRQFFPRNSVEYFISYYDYYQPEAYVPSTDTFIEKDASINEDIDRLRLRATSSLMERSDVVVVASVSAIYGLGDPTGYKALMLTLEEGCTSSAMQAPSITSTDPLSICTRFLLPSWSSSSLTRFQSAGASSMVIWPPSATCTPSGSSVTCQVNCGRNPATRLMRSPNTSGASTHGVPLRGSPRTDALITRRLVARVVPALSSELRTNFSGEQASLPHRRAIQRRA